MQSFFLALVLVLLQTQNPNLNIETKYDRFADVTTVHLIENLKPGGVVNLGGGSVYAPPGSVAHTVDLHIIGAVPGKSLAAAAPVVSIAISSMSLDWRYLNGPNTLRLILDDNERLSLGTMKRSGEVLKTGRVSEVLIIDDVPLATIERLSKATKIEMQAGQDEFEMKGPQISDIQDWVSRFPGAQPKLTTKPAKP